MKSIYHYRDARAYLREWLKRHPGRRGNSGGYRGLAKLLGMREHTLLWQIIQKGTHIPLTLIDVLPKALGLNERETKYFSLLLHLGNSDFSKSQQIEITNKFRPRKYN